MAYTYPKKGKIVRRLGVNIYGQDKFDRLLKRKPNTPGKQPGVRTHRRKSDYAQQLLEKQKIRLAYGLSEKQFHNLYKRAKKVSGDTGEQLVVLLERRLDNIIYRLGWAASRRQARQFVGHRHLLVNGKPLTIPSARLSPGDTVALQSSTKLQEIVRANVHHQREEPTWLSVNHDLLKATITSIPLTPQEWITGDIRMVTEYYARK
ncbi:MAG: 30S ribosomal protein S4 [Spirochaetota bacterium]